MPCGSVTLLLLSAGQANGYALGIGPEVAEPDEADDAVDDAIDVAGIDDVVVASAPAR